MSLRNKAVFATLLILFYFLFLESTNQYLTEKYMTAIKKLKSLHNNDSHKNNNDSHIDNNNNNDNNDNNNNGDDKNIFSYFNQNPNKTKPKVGIIGAGGYIGSKLLNFLHTLNIDVHGYDRNLQISNDLIQQKSSSEISTSVLHSYDTIIYFGGITGRIASELSEEKVNNENIYDILNLVKRMNSKQTLIFASTSAIAEGSGTMPVDET